MIIKINRVGKKLFLLYLISFYFEKPAKVILSFYLPKVSVLRMFPW